MRIRIAAAPVASDLLPNSHDVLVLWREDTLVLLYSERASPLRVLAALTDELAEYAAE